jgi:DNA mismatch endonuclease, patch repair protein
MSRIRSKHTKPEMRVRSLLHKMGYRFRLHVSSLPGNPDLVLPKYKTVIFVHGCFWHRHPECKYAYTPKTQFDFWNSKFSKNLKRHEEAVNKLSILGWNILIIWECQAQNHDILEQIVRTWLPR